MTTHVWPRGSWISALDSTHWAFTFIKADGDGGYALELRPVKESHSEPVGDGSRQVDTIASTPDEVIDLTVPVPARLDDAYGLYLDGVLAAAGYQRTISWARERRHRWSAPVARVSPVTPTEADRAAAAEHRNYSYDMHHGGQRLLERFPRLASLDTCRMKLLDRNLEGTDPLAPFPPPPPGVEELRAHYERLVCAIADGQPV